MAAKQAVGPLPAKLKAYCGADLALTHVKAILWTGQSELEAYLSNGQHASLRAGDLRMTARDELKDLTFLTTSAAAGLSIVKRGQELFKLHAGAMGALEALTTLPAQCREVVATVTKAGAPLLACLSGKPIEEGGIEVYPPVIHDLQLSMYSSITNTWTPIAAVSGKAERLAISACGRRVAYAVMKSIIPEEAERGEWFTCDLEPEAQPHMITFDAGRVGELKFGATADDVLYTANYETKRPITTHCRLFHAHRQGQHWPKTPLTGEDEHIQTFGWVPEENKVALTVLQGTQEISSWIDLASQERIPLPLPICAAMASSQHGLAYETEDIDNYPRLVLQTAPDTEPLAVPLPQPDDFSDLHVQIVQWKGPQGRDVQGLVCFSNSTRRDAALLVHAHGGPAVGFTQRRSIAADPTRYPYRHLIKGGYRVFMPLFRGTLGFGNEFSQANIQCQGQLDADLGDILAGIEALRSQQSLNFEDRVGIFGGSYGGFMSLRASATCDAFKCAVAMYGFVFGRYMSLEGGDFTWELEYSGDLSWPLQERHTHSDVFPLLHKIKTPTLLLHGKEDDICMVSNSIVAHRQLRLQRTPTELVVYPGEGHGFTQPQHRRDRDERTLAWFLRYLPPTSQGKVLKL